MPQVVPKSLQKALWVTYRWRLLGCGLLRLLMVLLLLAQPIILNRLLKFVETPWANHGGLLYGGAVAAAGWYTLVASVLPPIPTSSRV